MECRLKSLLLSPRWVPESARWLLTQGQVEEARRYLLHCARVNRRPVGEDSLSLEVRMNMCQSWDKNPNLILRYCLFS